MTRQERMRMKGHKYDSFFDKLKGKGCMIGYGLFCFSFLLILLTVLSNVF